MGSACAHTVGREAEREGEWGTGEGGRRGSRWLAMIPRSAGDAAMMRAPAVVEHTDSYLAWCWHSAEHHAASSRRLASGGEYAVDVLGLV